MLVPTAANRQAAFALYRFDQDRSEWRGFAVQVLTLQEDTISAVAHFLAPRLFIAFGLPDVLPSDAHADGHPEREPGDG